MAQIVSYKHSFGRGGKICFIEPPYGQFMERLDAPFALLYLAGVAERCGWEAEITEMHNFNDKIPEADVYGVTSSSPQFPAAKKLSKRLRDEFPDSLCMLGGNHISAVPSDLRQTEYHIGVVGEGETVLEDMLLGIGNIVGYPTNALKHQWLVSAKEYENVATIPFPARHLIDWSKYKRGIYWGKELLAPAVSMITSRGCPNNCCFCGSRVVFGRKTRFRSVDSVVAEIKHVVDTIGYKGMNFHDDTFCLDANRVIDMCKRFEELGIVWRCLSRVDTMTEEVVGAMQKGGCREIILGVESYSQKILNNLRKGTTVKQNLKAMKMVKKAGVQAKAGIIVGSPGETWETVKETIKGLKECPPDFWNVSVFTPFPGTPVWEEPEKFGIKILTRDLSQYAMVGREFKGIVVSETEKMKKEDIEQARDELIDLLKEIAPP